MSGIKVLGTGRAKRASEELPPMYDRLYAEGWRWYRLTLDHLPAVVAEDGSETITPDKYTWIHVKPENLIERCQQVVKYWGALIAQQVETEPYQTTPPRSAKLVGEEIRVYPVGYVPVGQLRLF